MFAPDLVESCHAHTLQCRSPLPGTTAGASILGGDGGTRPPQFLDWGGTNI